MFLQNKTVLITGGTGSMGQTLVHRILQGELGNPKKIIILSRDEAKQHSMRVKYQVSKNSTDEIIYRNFLNTLEFRIGDVRNYEDVCSAVKNADIVINAAALKQVPTCEYFPHQALLTNCIGASNIVRAIHENSFPVQIVLGISTDKACKPVNTMGMTKALQERIFISANVLNPKTQFLCVRYGNVLASRGSVIPLFHEQILHNGPVTITDMQMSRFLLTLDQAVDTVFAALTTGKPGEIFIPRAPSSLMIDVAKSLIGKKNIEIKLTGIRPGEKLYEIMISDEEAPYVVKRGNFLVIQSMLPELEMHREFLKEPLLTKEYSSNDLVLSQEETFQLLKNNNLLEIYPVQNTGELLR